jgi:hypothetical protein
MREEIRFYFRMPLVDLVESFDDAMNANEN